MKSMIERLKQGHRTQPYPACPPQLPDRFRGYPLIDPGRCTDGCRACVEVCPTDAIQAQPGGGIRIDTGRCVFCAECAAACPGQAITFTQDHRLAVTSRADLVTSGSGPALAKALDDRARRIFGHSLKLRQVSAGGCNACEADTNVLNTLVFDLGRFGIQFVASPRHADGLLITGPVTGNMSRALQKTYDAVPAPKLVIAVGACAISGGLYRDHPETCNGAPSILPVDLYVPGCPPHPYTILDGLLRLLDRMR